MPRASGCPMPRWPPLIFSPPHFTATGTTPSGHDSPQTDAVVRAQALRCCRETVRAALHRLKLSWKKAKMLLGRADPERRQAFIEQLQSVLAGAQRDRHLLGYVDEAHL